MKRICLLLIAVAFAGVSCERHEFEETRKLHDHHGHDDHGGEDKHQDSKGH